MITVYVKYSNIIEFGRILRKNIPGAIKTSYGWMPDVMKVDLYNVTEEDLLFLRLLTEFKL